MPTMNQGKKKASALRRDASSPFISTLFMPFSKSVHGIIRDVCDTEFLNIAIFCYYAAADFNF